MIVTHCPLQSLGMEIQMLRGLAAIPSSVVKDPFSEGSVRFLR